MSEIELLKQRITELERLVYGMQNYNTITPEFRKVLERGNFGASTKGSTTENQVVNEGGAATYSVLKAPDGFDQAVVAGAVHYYPYFT